MGYLKILLNARWLPWAVCAIALLIVYGLGYIKGSKASRMEMTEVMNQALITQMEVQAKISQMDLVIVAKAMSQERMNEKRFSNIPRTDSACNTFEWLRTFNAGIHAANSYSTAHAGIAKASADRAGPG